MPPRSGVSGLKTDLETGEVGCAVQSKYFSVGSVVPWAWAGVGAVATQAAGVAVTLMLWNQENEVRLVLKRLGINQPIVEVFSNDPRLANLVALDGPAPRRKTAGV